MKNSSLLLVTAFLCFLLVGVLFINSVDTVPPESPAVETTIVFTHWREFPHELFDSFEREFPGIKVDYQKYSLDDYSEVLAKKMAAHDPLDVIGIPECDYGELARQGLMKDLSNRVYISRYDPDVRKALKIGDAEYAVSYETRYYGVWFNRAVFKRYSLQQPGDFNDFLALCETLKANGVQPLVLGTADEEGAENLLLLRVFQGMNISGPEQRQFLESCIHETRALYENGTINPDAAELTSRQAFLQFLDNRAAMTVAPDTYMGLLRGAGASADSIGVFPVPFEDEQSPVQVQVSTKDCLIGIYSGTQSADAAESFLEYISRPEVAELCSNRMNLFPTMRLAADPSEFVGNWQPIKALQTVENTYGVMSLEKRAQLPGLLKSLAIPEQAGDAESHLLDILSK